MFFYSLLCFFEVYYNTPLTLFFFFFLMIRRPPRSTPFPTRRSSDLGSAIRVESPSHPLTVTPEEGKRLRVSFASAEVGLDRDVVLIARGLSDSPLTTVTLHGPEDINEP